MTPPSAPIAPNKAPLAGGPVRQPPEEQFWKHYSPHHEFPLSGVTSVAIHFLAVVLLILLGVIIKYSLDEQNKPVPVEAVTMEPEGGGGGNPNGAGNGPGKGDTATPREDVTPPDPTKPVPMVQLRDLPEGPLDPVQLPEFKDDRGERIVQEGNQAVKALAALDKDARQKVFTGLAGKGQGGSGTAGGKGSGAGPGEGAGNNDGKGQLTKRQKRVLRWTMTFSTQNGDDYARQLQGIRPGTGAVLAVPVAEGQYRVLRDLTKRPAMGAIEDLSQIKSIYWIDDKPESVAGLARALGIPAPPHIVAFFPPELESYLVKIEHDYKGRAEDDVYETKFDVVRTPEGYRPRVVSQTGKQR